MSFENVFLLITAIVNLLMTIIVIRRGWGNKINFYFSLLTFFNALWAAGLILVNLGINYELTRFFASFIYPIALMVVVSLFYFVVHFPYKVFDVPTFYKCLIVIVVIFYSIFCSVWYDFFVVNISLQPEISIAYEMNSYLVYSVVLLMLMLLSIIVLFIKFKKSEGIFRRQVLLVLVSVVIGTLAGTYFNLFFMYFHDVNHNYLGPLFTLIINFIAFYLIFSHKEK